jgi:transcriptional regulator of acetoin/glycerol metabolism
MLQQQYNSMEQAWLNFTTAGHCNGDTVPPPVLRSWQYCRDLGLPWEGWIEPTQVEHIQAAQFMMLLPVLEDIYEFVEGSECAIMLCDAEAHVVELVGDPEALSYLQKLHLGRRSNWSEACIGTNALALALQNGHPIATVGPAHWCRTLHPFAIVAAPFFGAEGEALGGIGSAMPATSFHAHSLSLVATVAQSIQIRLQMDQLLADANKHLTELNVTLETINEGLRVCDRVAADSVT